MPAAEARPNILFLFADDQRPDAAGAMGNPQIQTPHLDSLVRSGFVFRNAYCLGSHSPAVCLPSRNMLLSGQAYFRWKGPAAPADGPNLPAALKAAGYETYHHGKRGNTAPQIQALFDHNRYLQDLQDRTCGEPGKQIVDDAIAFLQDRNDTRPWCMYLAFANPHDPRVAGQKYLDHYRRDEIVLPKNYLPLHPFDNGEQLVRDERLAPWPRSKAEIRKHLHDYYAVITALDGHIGRLLAALKARGQFENTLIVFSSDHGLAMGSHGLMGKQSLYEHSMKAPLVFAGPGIQPGSSDALAYLLDIFPTLCEYSGAAIPAGLDGKSLKAVMEGRQTNLRDTLFLAYRDLQRAVRDQRYKLICYPPINKQQLFDLATDPDELQDLAADPSQQGRLQMLLTEMSRWQRELGDAVPLTTATPRAEKFVPPAP